MSTDLLGTVNAAQAELAQARPDEAQPGKAGPSRVRFGLASVLRWSERLVERVVVGYDRLFHLDARDTADIYMHISADLAKKGDAEDAVAALKRTLEILPDNADAWFQLGLIHLQQLQASAAALDAFRRAADLGCDSFELHFHLAEAMHDQGQHEEAVTELYRALDIDGDSAEAAYRLGVCLDKLGRFEEAVAAFKLAIARAPREVGYYQSLGFTLESLGQRKEAIRYFKQAVELERRSAGR